MISPAFADALRRNRERLNSRWYVKNPRGAASEFREVVAGHLDAAIASVAASGAPPERVDAVCDALFNVALGLWTGGRLGHAADDDAMSALFREALPAVPAVLAAEPSAVVSALSHAVTTLGRLGSDRARDWVEDVAAMGPHAADVPTLRSIGLVLAWRRGLAQARDAALEAFRALPPDTTTAIATHMGLSETAAPDVIARLGRRWRASPGSEEGPPRLEVVGFAGAFEAFGGPFATPPSIGVADGRIVAAAGNGSWVLHADEFGVALRPSPYPTERSRGGNAHVTANGVVEWCGLRTEHPHLVRASSWAATDDTLVVACSDSHRLRLVAVRGAVA